ncbi:MAG TPA: Hsp20/alpha crystallin family protein [Oculatellaceae cyanobacterium]
MVFVSGDQSQNGKTTQSLYLLSILKRLQGDLNDLYEGLSHVLGIPHHHEVESHQPNIDVKDADTEIIVTLQIPGVRIRDLDVSATSHHVVIAGEKRCEKEAKDLGSYELERDYAYFRRVLELPCEIQKEKVHAVFKSNVLTLTMPKAESLTGSAYQVTIKAD